MGSVPAIYKSFQMWPAATPTVPLVWLSKLVPHVVSHLHIVASCCACPIKLQLFKHKDDRERKMAKCAVKKKKKRFLVLTQEPRKSCYPTGSEHTIVGATVAGKSARAVTPILNGPQLQFQFPERRNISPLPACDFHADFWWTGGFFSSVAIYINTGHYYCKSGQTALEREPERFGCSRRFRDTLRRNLWFRLAADVAYSV